MAGIVNIKAVISGPCIGRDNKYLLYITAESFKILSGQCYEMCGIGYKDLARLVDTQCDYGVIIIGHVNNITSPAGKFILSLLEQYHGREVLISLMPIRYYFKNARMDTVSGCNLVIKKIEGF